MPTATEIRAAVEAVISEWQMPIPEIQGGNCEEFAYAVLNRIGGTTPNVEALWLDDGERQIAHCVIACDGRFYDAECPDGVERWQDIPFVIREREFRQREYGVDSGLGM